MLGVDFIRTKAKRKRFTTSGRLIECDNLPKRRIVATFGCLDDGIRFTGAVTAKVVVIDGPEHNATEFIHRSVLCLSAGHLLVVVSDPLIIVVGIRTHGRGVGMNNCPIGVLLDSLADLNMRNEEN